MGEIIIAGDTTAVRQIEEKKCPTTVKSTQGEEARRRHHNHHHSKTSDDSTDDGSKRKRRGEGGGGHDGAGDGAVDLSPLSTSEESGNHCLCCLCTALTGFVTNICLPALEISRCRTKKFKMDDPYAQNILKSLNQQFNHLYGFLHVRLLPAFRPLVNELCFSGCQMEADGLTVVCAQIWTATYLLKSELIHLNRADREKVRDNYVELAWECEKAFKIDEAFYLIQQRFKKSVLPKIWMLEEKYSGERRNFVDPELREDLSVPRPFDDLYLLPDEYTNVLKLKYYTKNSGPPTSMMTKNGRKIMEDKELDFSELSYSKRLNVILTLLQMSVRSVIHVGRGLQKSRKLLIDENDPITTSHTLDTVEVLLKMVKNEILLPSAKESEVIDWVCCIVDDMTSYVTCTDWVCDRMAEIRSMCQLCYEHCYYRQQLDLPAYDTLATEAINVQQRHQVGLDKYDAMKKMAGWKDFLKSTDLARPNLDTDQLSSFIVANNSDFFSSEYPRLRLPLFIDETRFIFYPQESAK